MKIRAFLRRLAFRTKISLSIIAILLMLGISLSFMISRYVSQALLAENKLRGVSNAVNLSARVVEPLLSIDFLELRNLVDEILKTNRDVAYAFVLDKAGDPLVHTFAGGFPVDLKTANLVQDAETYHNRVLATATDLIDDFAVPVLIAGERVGTVRIGMSRIRVQEVVNRLLWAIFLSIGTGILVVGFVSAALARALTRKIQVLHLAAKEMIKGNLDIQTAQPPARHCWELVQCGRMDCPAYGDKERRCWYLPATLCPTCVDRPYEMKITHCRHCNIYKQNSGDEIQDLAEFFDIMALTLKDRLEALKKTEQDLRQQQRVFQTILDVTPDMVSLQGNDLRYQAVNRAFCRFAGKGEEEILGKTDQDIFPAAQALQFLRENQEILENAEKISSERKIDTSGGERWIHMIKTAVMSPGGKVAGILSTSRDITDMKDLQDRMIHSQRLETIGQLAAGVAHEINTPLGIILGYTQLCKEDVEPGTEIHENLSTIEKYGRICRAIVSDLLRFSRQTESVKRPLDINQILRQIAGVVEHTFNLDRITIQRDFSPQLPAVFGDEEKLEQAFMNLLNNAHDAIGTDGEIVLSTTATKDEDEVVIRVADTGAGIPPEIREKIFDPFFTTKGVGKGTGLGLSVTFGIVKDHGGKIDFESICTDAGNSTGGHDHGTVPARGTVFTVRLPVYRGDKNL